MCPQATINAECVLFQICANFILYTAINVAGMYTKYLTDRGQRLAFIETHKAMEHKKESEKELQRTQKLLDSSEYNYQNFVFKEVLAILLLWEFTTLSAFILRLRSRIK